MGPFVVLGPFVDSRPFLGNMAYSLSKPSTRSKQAQETTPSTAVRLMGTDSVSKANYQSANSGEALFLWHGCFSLRRHKGRYRHGQDTLTQGLGLV